MRPEDIKSGRYYQRRRSHVVRQVIQIFETHDGTKVCRWRLMLGGEVDRGPVVDFARWARREVLPKFQIEYIPVSRCMECDELMSRDEEYCRLVCENCGWEVLLEEVDKEE